MEDFIEPAQEPQATKCRNCETIVQADHTYCDNCGYPQNGTDEDRNRFNEHLFNKKELFRTLNKKVKTAQTILFVIAGLQFVFGLIVGLNAGGDQGTAVFITMVIISGIYVGLGVWAHNQPYPAILTGTILYITLNVLDAVVDPTMLVRGIIIKIFILSAFFKGIGAAREATQLKKELADYKNL